MEKQTDLRIIKTKKLIKDSFYELVNEKGFEKVTINDIASRSMINRATFYLHYQDKYGLLGSLEDEVLDDIKVILSTITPVYVQSCVSNGNPFPHIAKIFSYIKENPNFFNLIMRNNIGYSFLHKLGELSRKYVYDITFSKLKSDKIFEKYSINIATAVFNSIVSQWIITGMKESVDEMTLLATKVVYTFL